MLTLVSLLLFTAFAQDDNIIDDCGAGFRIARNFLDETLYPSARCSDTTIGGYYISEREINFEEEPNPANLSFVIWLGDTPICEGQGCTDICEGSAQETAGTGICEGVGDIIDEDLNFVEIDDAVARCLVARATCTSDWWELFEEVTAGTILCEEDDFFGGFRRVFLPSCSLDYWLGNGQDQELQEGSFSDTMFQGKFIFDGVIDTLIKKENLTFADKIVFGGTRGGGIGALHLIESLRNQLKDHINSLNDPNLEVPEIFLLIDSSWLVSVEKFGPTPEERVNAEDLFVLNGEYQRNSSEWIRSAALLPSCFDKFSDEELFLCLFPSEIIQHHLNANKDDVDLNRALIFQSQYDLFQLADLGILEPNATDSFEDETAFAQGALNFIENYGQQVRNSIEEASRATAALSPESRLVGFFSPSCGQHGFIVPTRIHTINARTEDLGDAGSIRFQRDEFVWRKVAIENQILRDVIIDFVDNGVLPELRLDTCGEFLCNEECVTQIFSFVTEPVVSVCLQQLVLVYAVMVVFVFFWLFVFSYLRMLQWKKETKKFWGIIQNIGHNGDDHTAFSNNGPKRFEVLDKEAENDEVEFLRFISIQRDQNADEVQQQLIAETNANSSYRRAHLMAKNLSYWAPVSSKGLLCLKSKKKSVGKQIIRDISISFEPGKVHALMGPSGSGKSTLLELMSFSKSSGKISGSRYINGVSTNAKVSEFLKTWLKFNQSYVPQQDSFFSSLTVREHLEHAAWLILPEYMPTEAKLNRVWQLIRLLDLSSCADTICGDGGVNVEGGISGGQRRRLAVATQLLNNPCVLFLDEPTSGLDSVSALNLCRRLKTFASQTGMNVIMTIHQPRREIYSELDKLYILVEGSLVFTGSVERTALFFELDVYNPRLNVGNQLLDLLKDVTTHTDPLIQGYGSRFEQSEEYAQMIQEIEQEKTYLSPEIAVEVKETLVFNSLAEGRFSWRSPSSMFSLQWILISRTLTRGGLNLHLTILLSLIGGVILGGLFFQADSFDSKIGLVYLIVSTLTFFEGVFLARRYFDEKDIYDYEKKAGSMKSWQAFILTQYTKDGFTAVFESLMFAVPAYILGGLSLDLERAGGYLVLVVLIALATISQNVFFQIERNDVRASAFLQIGFLSLGALFNGFIIQLDDLPPYYAWIPYITLNFYGFVGILINEFADFSLPCDLSDLECASRTGDVVLQALGYDHLDVFLCALALIIITLIMRILGVIVFYLKYGRHARISRVAADGISPPEKNEVDVDLQGRTIQNVLNQQNPDLARVKTKKTQEEQYEEQPVGNEFNRFFNEQDQFPDSRNHYAEHRPQNATPNDEYDADNSEFDDDDEDTGNSLFQSGVIMPFITSTTGFLTLYLIDLASAGYICSLNEDTETLVIGISAMFLLAYFGQYVLQLTNIIPFTLEDEYSDFLWAFDLDGPSFLLFIFDAIAVFVQVTGVDDVFIVQILTLGIRIIRLLRVQLFFMKVSRSHRIRAESFLSAKNRIVVEYIKQMNDTSNDAPPPQPIGRLSGRDWLANLRSNEQNPRQSVTGSFSQMLSFMPGNRRRGNSGSFFASQGTQHTNASHQRTDNFGSSYINQQINRYRNSVALQPRIAVSSTQMEEERSQASGFSEADGWFKYRNDETGQIVYYNKYSGKYIDANEIERGL